MNKCPTCHADRDYLMDYLVSQPVEYQRVLRLSFGGRCPTCLVYWAAQEIEEKTDETR